MNNVYLPSKPRFREFVRREISFKAKKCSVHTEIKRYFLE